MSILSQFKQSQNTDFPNVRPSLDLRFALTKKLDPRITFTRGSTGTYFGSDGILRTAGVNEPRFDHDPITGQSLGLLIEESRSNLVAYSDAITSNLYGFSNSTLTQVTTTTPISGLTLATKVFLNVGANVGNSQNGFNFGTFSLTNSTVYTQSIFVKASGSSVFRLRSNVTGQVFDIPIAGPAPTPTGTITSCTVTPYPDGWSRISWTFTSTTSTPGNRGDHWAMKPNIADGSSGFLVTGAQLEAGAFPTSYIPTTASTVTRSADNSQMTGTNFSSWYNQSEGTIVISTDKLYPGNFDAYRHHYKIDSGSNADQITAYVGPGSNIITNYGITNAGRQVFDYQQITIGSSPTQFKVGQSLNSKYSFFTSSKGTTPPQLPSKSAPNAQNLSLATNMSRLFIGSHNTGGQINSHIARFTYYPIQLTNQQLINLCS